MICIDFETRSRADLKVVGAWKYAFDPSTEVLCLVAKDMDHPDMKNMLWIPEPYGLNQTSVSYLADKYLLTISKKMPLFLEKCLSGDGKILAHSTEFEWAVLCGLSVRMGWGELPIEKFRDTMAYCARSGLPVSLESACELMGLDIRKDMEGSAVMKRMCSPLKAGKNKGQFHYNVEDHVRLIDYCSTDVDATVELAEALPPLSPFEQAVWEETLRINRRGLYMDRNNIQKIIDAEIEYVKDLSLEIALGTDWEISAADMKRTKFLTQWMAERGVHTTSVDKESVTNLLKTDLPPDVRFLLGMRQQLGRSATAKYKTMQGMIEADDRIRGTFTYCGASKTGRFAGRGIQPHNLPRPQMGNDAIMALYDTLETADTVKAKELVTTQKSKKGVFKPAEVFSSLIRGAITAPKGKTLMAADYSAIEARGIFWLSDCQTGIDIFAASDAGTGPEPYIVMAADIYNIDSSLVDKGQRAVGKNAILGCLSKGTEVFTTRGWIAIEKVTPHDRVYDGESFVRCGGSIEKGTKPVCDDQWFPFTSDHKIFDGERWIEAENVTVADLDKILKYSYKSYDRFNETIFVPIQPYDDSVQIYRKIMAQFTQNRETYDILDAGEHNRFMIKTGFGTMVVHNCGYGMSGPKFQMTCDGYGIELPEVPDSYLRSYNASYERKVDQAEYNGIQKPPHAPKGQYIVDKYRKKFPEVVQYWDDLGRAAINATKVWGSVEKVGQVAFKGQDVAGKRFLMVRLPSGRCLWYFNPVVMPTVAPWGGMIEALHYECMHTTGKGGKIWSQISTYGAHLAENVCQAVCRDLLVTSMLNVRDQPDMDVVLHVHDELVVETDDRAGDRHLHAFERLVSKTPAWAEGFPVESAGWINKRYQKD